MRQRQAGCHKGQMEGSREKSFSYRASLGSGRSFYRNASVQAQDQTLVFYAGNACFGYCEHFYII